MTGRPDLAAIAAREQATSADDWEPYFNSHGDPWVIEAGSAPKVERHSVSPWRMVAKVDTAPDDYGRANALFIGHARGDVRALLAYIAELEG